MEVLAILLAVIILLVLLSLKNNVIAKLNTLQVKIDELSWQLKKLESERSKTDTSTQETAVSTPAVRPQQTATPPIREEVKRPEPEVRKEILQEFPRREELKKEEMPEQVVIPPTPAPVKTETPKPVTPPAPRKPGFFERNPDLEKFIGENLANKIGIAILVVGIGFFVKYAIDQNWINEIGRVFIGILCGGVLLGIAHRMRKTFAAFSSVLVGGGIAVLYFTITIAFHEYQIFSQTAAFLIMVVITGFTILLALGYNRIELAVLAILGGFGSPFMVSTGEGNYIVLFSYMLILNSGMLILAYYKKWRLVNIICYVFTLLIFAGWLSDRFDESNASMIRGALIFATLFYFIFFAMNIVNNLKERTKFEAIEITMLLSNTFCYYAAGMVILSNPIANNFTGLFTVLLALFNFIFAFTLYKNARADRNLVFLLIGLVLTFISLAAPIQLEGNYITLFWAAESVLLLWLSQKSGIKLMKVASVVVMVLMAFSIVIDWYQIYLENDYTTHLMVLLNKGYITGVVVLVSLVLTLRLLKNEDAGSIIKPQEYKFLIMGAVVAVLYIVNLLELRYQLLYYIDSYATRTVIVGAYNMLFVLFLVLAEKQASIPQEVRKAFPFVGVFAIGAYLLYYHSYVINARDEYLQAISSGTGFYFHYVLIILVVVSAFLTLRTFNKMPEMQTRLHNSHWWFYIFFFVFVASAELDHIVLLVGYQDSDSIYYLIEENHRIGYPILWGVTSFMLIALGLKKKIKMLRIISLALFLITLLKLFIVDLRDISEGGKIAAFISLGVLLLVVSFMYQRLKKLLLEDSRQENNDVA